MKRNNPNRILAQSGRRREENPKSNNSKSKSHISLHKHSKKKLPQFIKSIRTSPKTAEESSKDPRLAGILLPDEIHLISLAVVDFEFCKGC